MTVRPSFVAILFPLLLVACDQSHARVDGGEDDVWHECVGARDGARCDFAEPCFINSDFWMGRCGTEEWRCEDGRVVYTDSTFACGPLDGGTDAGPSSWCDDYVPPPALGETPCRSAEDCGATDSCWVPGDTSPFYASGSCPMECSEDADCVEICVSLNGGACGRCEPSCTPDSCRPWESCEDDGHCAPQSCEAGYVCPPGGICAPTDGDADPHGCVLAPCASDVDCGCGACVMGRCHLGPGICEPPRV